MRCEVDPAATAANQLAGSGGDPVEDNRNLLAPSLSAPHQQYERFRPCARSSATGHANLSRHGGFFGKRLGEYFGMEAIELLEMNWRGKPALVVTRLTSSRSGRMGGSQISPEPAFSIVHPLGDVDSAGGVRVMDLRNTTRCEMGGPVDLLQYYVPCHALVDLAREHGNSPVQTLSWESERRDPFLSMLSALLLRAVHEDCKDWRLFVQQFTLSVLAYFAQRYGGLRARDSVVNGGLAPWQERRAKEMMRAGLASNLSVGDIAAQCRLTPSHFARSFKRSTGLAPHRFLTRLRVEEAKRLMLMTQLSLADIALACGFGEQSYFTRVFSRSVGASPGAWRRLRLER